MFIPYDGIDSGFTYRGVPVRFTYRADLMANHVGEMDIDGVLPGDTRESRFHRLIGPWDTRDQALSAAQEWAAAWLDKHLGASS